MDSTVRNYPKETTQRNWTTLQQLTTEHLNTQSFGKSINQMTILFFKVNGDTFILRKITDDPTTESLDVKLEAIETGLQTKFKCFKGSEHYSFVKGLYKNPPPAEKKAGNELSKWWQRPDDHNFSWN